MPDWIIWLGAIWLFFAITGRSRCSWGGPGPGRRRGRVSSGASIRPGPRAGRRSPDRALRPTPPRETTEERLRRQFVEGRLTMEEYEDRLWQELGPRSGSGNGAT